MKEIIIQIKSPNKSASKLLNDVLLAKDGSYFRYAFVVKEDREIAVLSSIAILRPKTDIIDPHYLREFSHLTFPQYLNLFHLYSLEAEKLMYY